MSSTNYFKRTVKIFKISSYLSFACCEILYFNIKLILTLANENKLKQTLNLITKIHP